MLIHVIRHTKPQVEPGICYGQTDLPVTESFDKESMVIKEKLLAKYDAVYTSPLQRCALLAEQIPSAAYFTDDRIMEYDFGDWEMLPWDEFKSDDAQKWMTNFVDIPAPNGENMQIMQARVLEFFADLQARDHTQVAVVTHSGVQRLLHGHILATPMNHLFRLVLDFGAVLEINADNASGLLTVKHV